MAPCASPKQYRSLARPSSAAEPSHPPDGVVTACSRRLDFRPGIFCVWLDSNWPTYCYTEAYVTSPNYSIIARVHGVCSHASMKHKRCREEKRLFKIDEKNRGEIKRQVLIKPIIGRNLEIYMDPIGIALIVLGFFLLFVEATMPGFLIAVPATVVLVFGIILMIDSDIMNGPGGVILLLGVGVVTLVGTLKFYQSLAPPVDPATGGIIEHIGKTGKIVKTVNDDDFSGKVKIGVEKVRAISKEGEIAIGTKVEVISAEGIHVTVVPIKGDE